MIGSIEKSLTRQWPIGLFGLAFLLIVGTILVYMPAWGLQDDFQSLHIAKEVWQSPHFFKSLWHVILEDFNGWGIFRPVYYSTVVITYHFLKDVPWLIYILVAGFNFASLWIWGNVLTKIFRVREEDRAICTFLFPLSFLIFTPVWNIFTHISFQEKYIVLFSGVALFYLERAYSQQKPSQLIWVMLALVVGMLSKPTQVYLVMVFVAFAALDVAFIKYQRRISWWVLSLNAVLFIGYYWFITVNLRGYAGQYSLSIGTVIGNLISSSFIIKGLILAAVGVGTWMLIMIFRNKNDFSPLALAIPAGLLSYVMVLAPWRLVNYLFSALAPYALAVFFPIYIWMLHRSKASRTWTHAGLIFGVLVVFVFIAVPRYAKLADVKNVEAFLAKYDQNKGRYFFPPPFSETARAIATFSSTEVIFLPDGQLGAAKLSQNKANYLIVNDEASTVNLRGVIAGGQIYENDTWKIFKLVLDKGHQETFGVDFPENPVARLKTFLRDMK